jgi:hypothetical protein
MTVLTPAVECVGSSQKSKNIESLGASVVEKV